MLHGQLDRQTSGWRYVSCRGDVAPDTGQPEQVDVRHLLGCDLHQKSLSAQFHRRRTSALESVKLLLSLILSVKLPYFCYM